MANGGDRLLEQLARKEARESRSPFLDAFSQQFGQSLNTGQRQFGQQQLLNQRLQNQLLLQGFQQQFKQQQADQLQQAINQPTAQFESTAPKTITTQDKDSSEVGLLENKMSGIQKQIDGLSRFAGNPAARVKIDSLREEQKRTQKRIDRVRDRKTKREDIVTDRIQTRLDKLNDLGGNVDRTLLSGLEPQDQIDIINAEIQNFSKARSLKQGQAERKEITAAESLQGELGELITLIEGPGSTSAQLLSLLPASGGSLKAQQFSLLKTSIGERLLRLRSGAQINEQEFKRFMKLLPSVFRFDELDLSQLRRFKTEFESVSARINQSLPPGTPGAPQPTQPQFSQDALLAEARRRGLVP